MRAPRVLPVGRFCFVVGDPAYKNGWSKKYMFVLLRAHFFTCWPTCVTAKQRNNIVYLTSLAFDLSRVMIVLAGADGVVLARAAVTLGPLSGHERGLGSGSCKPLPIARGLVQPSTSVSDRPMGSCRQPSTSEVHARQSGSVQGSAGWRRVLFRTAHSPLIACLHSLICSQPQLFDTQLSVLSLCVRAWEFACGCDERRRLPGHCLGVGGCARRPLWRRLARALARTAAGATLYAGWVGGCGGRWFGGVGSGGGGPCLR